MYIDDVCNCKKVAIVYSIHACDKLARSIHLYTFMVNYGHVPEGCGCAMQSHFVIAWHRLIKIRSCGGALVAEQSPK